MIRLKYVGAVLDVSGYATAARNYISALIDRKDIDLTVRVTSFEHQKVSHGTLQEKITPFIDRKLDPEIQIVHLTPENFPTYRDPQCYNIAYTAWETDTLPSQWIDLCNMMDEIWVPSKWNIEVFKNSGVKKPVYRIPHIVSLPDTSDAEPVNIDISDDTFVFYSIFQWLERKNPMALMKAYLTEFKPDEKVVFALKAYRVNTSQAEKAIIKEDIARIKKSLNMDRGFPPLVFFGNLMTAAEMKGLHMKGDCFVLAHRAEGFGIPHAEAMSYGKPVISTNYSGNLEFMNDDNSFLIDYQETPVAGMIFPNYKGHMTWADPNIMHLRRLMRTVFEDRQLAATKAENAVATIRNELNSTKIGELMVNRLKEIKESFST